MKNYAILLTFFLASLPFLGFSQAVDSRDLNNDQFVNYDVQLTSIWNGITPATNSTLVKTIKRTGGENPTGDLNGERAMIRPIHDSRASRMPSMKASRYPMNGCRIITQPKFR